MSEATDAELSAFDRVADVLERFGYRATSKSVRHIKNVLAGLRAEQTQGKG